MPEVVDQLIARNDLASVQQQEREQCTLLAAPQTERSAVLDDLERAEDTELHPCMVRKAQASCNAPATKTCPRANPPADVFSAFVTSNRWSGNRRHAGLRLRSPADVCLPGSLVSASVAPAASPLPRAGLLWPEPAFPFVQQLVRNAVCDGIAGPVREASPAVPGR